MGELKRFCRGVACTHDCHPGSSRSGQGSTVYMGCRPLLCCVCAPLRAGCRPSPRLHNPAPAVMCGMHKQGSMCACGPFAHSGARFAYLGSCLVKSLGTSEAKPGSYHRDKTWLGSFTISDSCAVKTSSPAQTQAHLCWAGRGFAEWQELMTAIGSTLCRLRS